LQQQYPIVGLSVQRYDSLNASFLAVQTCQWNE